MEKMNWASANAEASFSPRTGASPRWSEGEIARRSCLDMLMSRFGIDAALVSAPQLARALGMSKSTIYASLKEGRFFIPHRMVGRSPMFTIDDVATWYLSGDVQPSRIVAADGASARSSARFADIEGRDEDIECVLKKKRDRDVDAWVAKALSSAADREVVKSPSTRR